MPKMRAAIFVEPSRIVLDEKPIPDVGPLDALMSITTTTICGTDIHILKGEYPVAKRPDDRSRAGRYHREAGFGGVGLREGQRVIAGAITPSGHSYACLCGCGSQDGRGRDGTVSRRLGGWKFGNLDRRLPGRLCFSSRRLGQPESNTGRSHRRTGPDVPGYHVDRLLRR